MNPTQSTPRSSEAALLEADYLLRLHEALSHCPKSEAVEIEENVTNHIQAAVDELETGEVSLSQMAIILEELGPPEAMISEPEEGFTPKFEDDPLPEKENFETSGVPAAKVGEREFLDRLFVGYLIVTFGLFIPVIELYFCSIIGFAVLWRILRKAPTPEIAATKMWAGIVTIAAVAMFPAGLLTLAHEFFGLLYLPIGMAWLVGDIVLFWTLFGGLANWLDGKHMGELAEETRSRRIYYIITSFALFVIAIIVGLIVGVQREAMLSSFIGLAFIPVTWVVNWFLILKPILKIRKSI